MTQNRMLLCRKQLLIVLSSIAIKNLQKGLINMETLRDFRTRKNLTQRQLAIKLNISPSYYIKVEQGMVKAGRGFIEKFIQTFPGESADMFFGGDRE